jgi:hypothetical protein
MATLSTWPETGRARNGSTYAGPNADKNAGPVRGQERGPENGDIPILHRVLRGMPAGISVLFRHLGYT